MCKRLDPRTSEIGLADGGPSSLQLAGPRGGRARRLHLLREAGNGSVRGCGAEGPGRRSRRRARRLVPYPWPRLGRRRQCYRVRGACGGEVVRTRSSPVCADLRGPRTGAEARRWKRPGARATARKRPPKRPRKEAKSHMEVARQSSRRPRQSTAVPRQATRSAPIPKATASTIHSTAALRAPPQPVGRKHAQQGHRDGGRPPHASGGAASPRSGRLVAVQFGRRVVGQHPGTVAMNRHRGMVPDDQLDKIRWHSGRQPQRLDPAVFGPQTARSRDDPTSAREHREDMAADRVVADLLLRTVGVEAARAVRGRAAMWRAVLPEQRAVLEPSCQRSFENRAYRPPSGPILKGAQCPDLAYLWLETPVGIHRSYLAGAGPRCGSGRSGDAGCGVGSGIGSDSANAGGRRGHLAVCAVPHVRSAPPTLDVTRPAEQQGAHRHSLVPAAPLPSVLPEAGTDRKLGA